MLAHEHLSRVRGAASATADVDAFVQVPHFVFRSPPFFLLVVFSSSSSLRCSLGGNHSHVVWRWNNRQRRVALHAALGLQPALDLRFTAHATAVTPGARY